MQASDPTGSTGIGQSAERLAKLAAREKMMKQFKGMQRETKNKDRDHRQGQALVKYDHHRHQVDGRWEPGMLEDSDDIAERVQTSLVVH